MNIKGRLEVEADGLVATQRDSGVDVHDLLAKHCADRKYNDETVRSLTALVNRHAFKKAMEIDKRDEIKVAHAHRVLGRLHAAPEVAVKTAALNPGLGGSAMRSGSAVGGKLAADWSPAILGQLDSRSMELGSQIKAANAELRGHLIDLARRAQTVLRVGLHKVAGYQQALDEIPPGDRKLVELALEAVPTEKVAFTAPQLRMFVPAALEDTRKMGQSAKAANEVLDKLADLTDRLDRVRQYKQQIKGA